MDIKQLLYFLTIAEEGNISKAAEKLHIAQPPLSQQLKLLEEELGVTLFERSTRKLKITDMGENLRNRARQILDLIDTTEKEIKDMKVGIKGILKIGTVSSAGATLLPEMLLTFHEEYPHINFEIVDDDTDKIIEMLKIGVIDIGIIRTPHVMESFESIGLPLVPMVVAGRNLREFIGEESIPLTILSNKPLIVQRRYEKNIIDICLESGMEPRIICRSNDVRTVLLWASMGIGLAIVPKDCIGLIQDSSLEVIDINEASLMVGTAIIWSKEHYQTFAARTFLTSLSFKKNDNIVI